VETPLITSARGWFGRPAPGITAGEPEILGSGPSFAADLLSALEARALWGRYGL